MKQLSSFSGAALIGKANKELYTEISKCLLVLAQEHIFCRKEGKK